MNDRNRGQKSSSKRGRSNNQASNGARRGGKGRSRKRSKKVDPTKYWGDPEQLRIPETFVTETPDSSTVIASLGRAPIPGQENASKHYFSLLYDRAAALSVALAAAGRIHEMAELDQAGGSDDDLDGNRLEKSVAAVEPNEVVEPQG